MFDFAVFSFLVLIDVFPFRILASQTLWKDLENTSIWSSFRYLPLSIRYLTCADCEQGILGIQYLGEGNNFYLSADRVQYKN
jgi:hypothetical protein